MSLYQEILDDGGTEEEAISYLRETSQDLYTELQEKGEDEKDIQGYLADSYGVDSSLLFPAADIEEPSGEEETKTDIINSEYNSAIKIIENKKANIDKLNLDEDTKKIVLNSYDLGLQKAKEAKIDKLRKEEEYLIKKQEQDNKKLEEDKKKELQSNEELDVLNRVDVGLGEVQGGLRINVLAPAAEMLGMNETAEQIKAEGQVQVDKAKEIEQKFIEAYGQDSWNIAQNIGSFTPEAIAGAVTSAKRIPQALAESGITYAKTGDVQQAGRAGLISLVGGKIADEVFKFGTKKVKTAFQKEIDKLPLEKKEITEKVFDVLDKEGINKLDEEGRAELISKIDFTKDKTEASKQVVKELNSLKKSAEKKVKDVYDVANKKASAITGINISKDDVLNIAKKETGKLRYKSKDELKAYREVKSILGLKKKSAKSNDFTAEEIEKLISSLKKEQRNPNVGSGSMVYGDYIGYLNDIQKSRGGENIYKEARALSKEFNTKFTSRIDGEGYGSKISEVLIKNEDYNVAEKLLASKFDPNIAKELNNIGLSDKAKKLMLKDHLTQGLDMDELSKTSSIDFVLDRYSKLDKNAVKLMLGKDYKKFSGQIEALNVINNTVKENNKVSQGIKSDIRNLVASVLVAKASPVFATKGILMSGTTIIDKTILKKTRSKILARKEEILDNNAKRRFVNSVNALFAGIAAEATKEEEEK